MVQVGIPIKLSPSLSLGLQSNLLYFSVLQSKTTLIDLGSRPVHMGTFDLYIYILFLSVLILQVSFEVTAIAPVIILSHTRPQQEIYKHNQVLAFLRALRLFLSTSTRSGHPKEGLCLASVPLGAPSVHLGHAAQDELGVVPGRAGKKQKKTTAFWWGHQQKNGRNLSPIKICSLRTFQHVLLVKAARIHCHIFPRR